MDEIIRNVAVFALPVLLAITLHEAAHAFAAKYFGDTTAYAAGRMSLNPVKHIDPFGTLIMPLALYLSTAGLVLFGYAKPVPIDFARLNNPRRDMAWVALAGPAANLVMALMWMIGLVLFNKFPMSGTAGAFAIQMCTAGVTTNLLILAFNLVPIPPLDGGRVLTSLLPVGLAAQFVRIEPFGFIIMLVLLVTKVLNYWLLPLMAAGNYLLQILIIPLTLLLS